MNKKTFKVSHNLNEYCSDLDIRVKVFDEDFKILHTDYHIDGSYISNRNKIGIYLDNPLRKGDCLVLKICSKKNDICYGVSFHG